MKELKKLAEKSNEMKNILKLRTALETLQAINWKIPIGNITDDQYTYWNLELNTKSCLGRAAVSALIVEKYFPNERLMAAEVLKDGLVQIMFEIPIKERTDDNLREILVYEDPHMIITVGGEQYDSLSSEIKDLHHPVIKEFSTWKAIYASRAISESKLINEPLTKIAFLNKLKEQCNLCLIDEHLIGAYSAIGDFEKAKVLAKRALEIRPNARLYFVLYLLTQEQKYKNYLVEIYGANMFNVITKSF